MISIKQFLDAKDTVPAADASPLLNALMNAYSAALAEMAQAGQSACPSLGQAFREQMTAFAQKIPLEPAQERIEASGQQIRLQLTQWGQDAARHYQQKSEEVKGLLLEMLRTADGVGARDQRCAGQIHQVTEQLKAVASLDDLTEIRASLQNSAVLLKSSIDRMTEEGSQALQQLRTQVSGYQTKLEEAEKLALRDGLTGLLNRLCIEKQIERRIDTGVRFCVAVIDLDGFKKINDQHGHLAGDELLKQFAGELSSASRSEDLVGRWGGDEFILIIDGTLEEASTRIERLDRWICGNYTLQSPAGSVSVPMHASIGLAGHNEDEPMNQLLARADKAMYANKAATSAR
ncbi:MAG: GGDEF domain-containing protein [Terracidiphilus sp.]|nr:GGDEF domain-containing protein [Terracidiphilus sp.]